MVQDSILINLREISFGYPARPGLFSDLDFSLRAGGRIGIIGSNGSGKTTLLYIMMGLLKPKSGTVELFGMEMRSESSFREARRRIGFLFQDSDDQLFCPTVRDEIGFGPLNFGLKREEVKEIIKRTLGLVGLEGFEDRSPYNLSDGEKRKVALAAILAMDPEILILDEPTNGLDQKTVEKIVEILNTQEISYIIVSQNKQFLGRTTKAVYSISNGRTIPTSL